MSCRYVGDSERSEHSIAQQSKLFCFLGLRTLFLRRLRFDLCQASVLPYLQRIEKPLVIIQYLLLLFICLLLSMYTFICALLLTKPTGSV